MSWFLTILAFLTALLPIADREYQTYKQMHPKPSVAAPTSYAPALPPETGRSNIVFYRGEWWKYENGTWLVWRQNPQYIAQGGAPNVSR